MAASRAVPQPRAVNRALGLCWGAWSELGVSGWARSHRRWAIDVEPLIIFTARLGDRDPRLRDEVQDWCIRYNRYVSRARLRSLVRSVGDDDAEAWGEFAATVSSHTKVQWPGATVARGEYRITGRSSLRDLSEPSLVGLRMRALFGLGARTEVLQYLLLHGEQSMTVAALSAATGYTKRIIANECEALERAGALSVRAEGNRFHYSLARPHALRTLVGELPPIRPDWTALLHMVTVLLRLDESANELPQSVLTVEARKAYREIEDDLTTLDLSRPPNRHGDALISEMAQWSNKTLADLSQGAWPSAGA